jgi:hypothetical protein
MNQRVAGILWTLVIDLGKISIPRLRLAGILWTLVIDLGIGIISLPNSITRVHNIPATL